MDLREALQQAYNDGKKLEQKGIYIFGITFQYDTFQSFIISFEDDIDDGPWYSIWYTGGIIGSTCGEEESLGGVTINEAIESADKLFCDIKNVNFFLHDKNHMGDTAEYILNNVFPSLPNYELCWGNELLEFTHQSKTLVAQFNSQ